MAKKEKEYQRLPGKGSANEGFIAVAGVNSRLFMGRDHLLRINSNGWTESYRRFYFSDIQALNISQTSRQSVLSAINASICVLLIFWLLATDNTPGRVILGCVIALFATMLVVNLVKGPTCKTRIQTRIGTEPLPSLDRMRNVRRVIALLKPHIDAAQGALSADEVSQRAAELRTHTEASAGAASASRQPGAAANETSSYRGALHGWLFAVFMVEAGALALNMFSPGPLAALVILGSSFAGAGLTIVSLVKQGRSALGAGVRNVTWAALAHVVIAFVGGYALMVTTVMQNPKIASDQGALFVAMSEMQGPWIRNVYLFMAAYALIVSLAGFVTLMGSRASMDSADEASMQL